MYEGVCVIEFKRESVCESEFKSESVCECSLVENSVCMSCVWERERESFKECVYVLCV